MNLNTYEFRLFGCNGEFLTTLDTLISADFGRQKNEEGICEIILPPIYDFDIFDKDCILEIWRHNPLTNNMQLVGETCWFLRKIRSCSQDDCAEEITLTFYDTINLLKRRFVAWTEVDPDPVGGYAANYPSSLNLPPDLLIKRILYHNFIAVGITDDMGSGVPDYGTSVGLPRTPMDITLNDLTTPIGGAAAIKHTFSKTNCLEAMKAVANAFEARDNRELWFDIIYTPSNNPTTIGELEFKVFYDQRGEDLSYPNGAVFGPEYNNFTESCIEFNWEEEVTRVYYVGEEEDLDLDGIKEFFLLGFARDADAERCQFYEIDTIIKASGEQDDIDTLDTKALAELGKLRSKITLSGNILQIFGSQLFIDYNYGDKATVKYKNYLFNSTISKFSISIDESAEQITVPFESIFEPNRILP